jgi:hypothetical protein
VIEAKPLLLLLLLLLIYLFKLQVGFCPVVVVLQKDPTHKITQHTQTKHNTQNYTHNKGQFLTVEQAWNQ